MDHIRNFVIIAHIDHGKSTLADRFLEATGTVDKRLMKPQYLDQLELERERGITIKMAPVRMQYRGYVLNLIDTPGHSDFSYEVSRALAAVEGAILLVDATQGIQAQTLANYAVAKRAGLTVIGAVNKIDSATTEQIEQAGVALADLLAVPPAEPFRISGKTGSGVEALLHAVVARIPPPRRVPVPPETSHISRALVFDSLYDDHKGVIAFVRMVDGAFRAGERVRLLATNAQAHLKEVGFFFPELRPAPVVSAGEIGYIATGIKNPDDLTIGDTVLLDTPELMGARDALGFPGYRRPNPVVFVSLYPADASRFAELRQALGRLRLTDASLTFEPDVSDVLGRGFKGGFLGRLHFEITVERLKREFRVETVHSFPSVEYRVKLKSSGPRPASRDGEWISIRNPREFPDEYAEALEPMVRVEILTPTVFLGAILQLKESFRFFRFETRNFGGNMLLIATLPLADLIRDLDDRLKSVSQGFASFSYELIGWGTADVVKMAVFVLGNEVAGLTRILPRNNVEREARRTVGKLKALLPREQFEQAIQAVVGGRIVARETIPAFRKDVTGYLYGGDRTRKMKLWKKQQKGKKKLEGRAAKNRVKISASIFQELLKTE